jgi:type I restriction enzyme M protein
VDCIRPQIGETICDPACGTGGFLLAAYESMSKNPNLDRDERKLLKSGTFHGIELVDSVTRLCAMNMLLHGIGSEQDSDLPVQTRDGLAGKHGEYNVVLTNPPFGRKSSVTIIAEDGESAKESLVITRDDFWATTSNKQLNFVQHVFTILKQHGRAAVVVPDNVLFEGGAGEIVRRRLLAQADVHTLLRLPTGIFYAQGVKANVIFFDRRPASEKPWTKSLWIYDLRTNKEFTLKTRQLKREDLDEFVGCYNPENRHERTPTWSEENPQGRWREYTCDQLMAHDKVNLDITWLRDESLEDGANLPDPDMLAAEIAEDLQAALEQFAALAVRPEG